MIKMISFIILSALASSSLAHYYPTQSTTSNNGKYSISSGAQQQHTQHIFQSAEQEYHNQRPEGEKTARVLHHDSERNGHGYQYRYETENGIKAQEVGNYEGKGVSVQGEYSYTGDDGQVYTVTYTADETGFHPSGAHLPTPPPVPEEILKGLEQNARDEAAGIFDDGSYHDSKQIENNHLTQDYQQYQGQQLPLQQTPVYQQYQSYQDQAHEMPTYKVQGNQSPSYQVQSHQDDSYLNQGHQYQVQNQGHEATVQVASSNGNSGYSYNHK